MATNVTSIYKGCDGDLCECSRKILSEIDPLGETYKTLLLVGIRLNKLIPEIESIHDEQEILSLQLKLKDEYNVSLLKWHDTPIYIRKTPGLCKRTRRRLLIAFQKVNENHPKLLSRIAFDGWIDEDEQE